MLKNLLNFRFHQLINVSVPIRHAHKPKPRMPHYNRVLYTNLTKPKYAEVLEPCGNLDQTSIAKDPVARVEHPYGRFLTKELRKDFYAYPMIGIFHQNLMKEVDILHLRGHFYDADLPIKFSSRLNSTIARLALENTKFAPALQLIGSPAAPSALGFFKTLNLPLLIKLMKKAPALILIGVIWNGERLLNRADIDALASMNLDTARAQLAHILDQTRGQLLVQSLEGTGRILSRNLQYLADKDKDKQV